MSRSSAQDVQGVFGSLHLPIHASRDATFACLVPWSPLPAWLTSYKTPLLAWLRKNTRFLRSSPAWLVRCWCSHARLATPCAGRWREAPRVTSPVPAIHRPRPSSSLSLSLLLPVSHRLRRRRRLVFFSSPSHPASIFLIRVVLMPLSLSIC